MLFLSFRAFVWPQNPHTYQEEAFREAHYHTENGSVYYDGLGPLQRKVLVASSTTMVLYPR